MLIKKMGFAARHCGINSKVYGVEVDNVDLVLSAPYSCMDAEVGMKLFARFYLANESIISAFRDLSDIFHTSALIARYCLFSISVLQEYNTYYRLQTCGNLIVIKVDNNDEVTYDYFDYKSDPPYMGYNYMYSPDLPKYTKEFVDNNSKFETKTYDKTDYKHIGIASLGMRAIIDSNLKDTFEGLLLDKNVLSINRMLYCETAKRRLKDDVVLALR